MMPPSSMMRRETILLVGPLCLWKAGPTLNQSPSNLPALLLSFHISIPFSIALLPGGDLLAVGPILIQIHAIPLPESDGSDESAFESHQIDAPIRSLVLQEHIEDASTCTALHNLAEMEAHHVREPGFPRDLPGDVEGGLRARMEEEAGARVVLDACAIHSLRSDVRLQWRRVEHRSSGRGDTFDSCGGCEEAFVGEPCSVQAEGVVGRSYGRASHIHPVHALKSCGG